MPKKLNSHGNMQNYIEAGHGDASGEYGDNASGSNVHFKTFKKPARTSELSKKQLKEIHSYIKYSDLENENRVNGLIRNLRFWGGSFGDLSSFSDDELKDIMKELQGLEKSDDLVWYKDGSSWVATKEIGLLNKLGVDYYTLEEKKAKQTEENRKIIEKSQNETDKEIQKVIGDGCTVCFGKGYNKEDLKQILEDTKTYVNDFPELKNQLKLMGDRNNLKKLVNAMRNNTEPTEEEITKAVEKLKKVIRYYGAEGEELEKKYREEAIKRLQQPLKLARLNKALAYWSPNENAMIYMGKMKKRDNDDTEQSYKMNWHSSNKVNGVYCHEMGHAVDTALANKYQEISKKLEEKWKNEPDNSAKNFETRNNLGIAYQNFKNNIRELENQNYNSEYKAQYDALMSEKLGTEYNGNNYNRNIYEADKQVKEELNQKGIRKWNLSEYAKTNTKEFIAESFSAYYSGMDNPLANKVVEAFKEFSKKLKEFE